MPALALMTRQPPTSHALTPIDTWLVRAREIAVIRPNRADYASYERMKREFQRDFPLASPSEYERAMSAVARMFGV